jgi:tetratricopeptide (TPR) repeat protein
VGFRAGIVDSLIALGLVDKLRGDLTSAQHHFGEALSTADEMDVSPQRVAARRNLGQLFLLMGNSMAAADVISGAFSLAESMSHTLEYAPTALAMAQVNAQAGNSTLALELAEMAVDASRSAEHIVESNVFVTSLLCSLGDVARAAPRAEQATHHAELMHAPRLLGVAYLGTARLAFARGLIDTAAQQYAGAVRQFELARTPTERALAEGEYLGCLKGERPHVTP